MQAMFAGCPVIGADSGGIPDVVIPGKTGLLVPPDDVEKTAAALLKILQNRPFADQMAKQAEQFVRKHYTIDIMGRRILSLYENMI